VKRLFIFVSLFLAAIAFSCTIFNGVVADPPPDGGSGGAQPDAAAEASDGCEHKLPPSEPARPGDGVTIDAGFVVVGKSIRFGDPSFGYDLDGVCSCTGRGGTDRGTCVPPDAQPPDFACDGEGGVDNVAGRLSGGIGGFDLEESANNGIASGTNAIVVRIEGYNGTPNDPEVMVSFFRSFGPVTPTGEKIKPDFDQFQEWSIDRASLDPMTTETANDRGRGRVVNGKLVAELTTVTILPNLKMTVKNPSVTGEIKQDALGRYFLTNVIVGGRWPIDEALNAIGQYRGDDGLPICDPASKYGYLLGLMRATLCLSLDLNEDPKNANKGLKCDALSAGAIIETVPAKYGRTVDADASVSQCARAKSCGEP
jgi:hypothetical protein